MTLLIEGCIESLAAAEAAEQGGAHRLELCADLAVGGTTPAIDLVAACVSRVKIPVFVMVRPRGGKFCYSAAEHVQMLNEIKRVKDAGGLGIVTGSLRADKTIDEASTRDLVAAAHPLPLTFHRAFDETPDTAQALELLIGLGVTRVLTSGSAPTAPAGAAAIAKLVRRAAGRIAILAGGGINGDNVAALVRTSGVREVHLSTQDSAKIQRVALSLHDC